MKRGLFIVVAAVIASSAALTGPASAGGRPWIKMSFKGAQFQHGGAEDGALHVFYTISCGNFGSGTDAVGYEWHATLRQSIHRTYLAQSNFGETFEQTCDGVPHSSYEGFVYSDFEPFAAGNASISWGIGGFFYDTSAASVGSQRTQIMG